MQALLRLELDFWDYATTKRRAMDMQRQTVKSRTKADSKREHLFTRRQSRAERRAMGKGLRDACPRPGEIELVK